MSHVIDIISSTQRARRADGESSHERGYRYFRSPLEVSIGRKGTAFLNLDQVAHELRRPAEILFQFFQLECGVHGSFSKRRLSGQHSPDWDTLIQLFIDDFIECGECHGIGTRFRTSKRHDLVFISCHDCGAKTEASGNGHRLCRFIVKKDRQSKGKHKDKGKDKGKQKDENKHKAEAKAEGDVNEEDEEEPTTSSLEGWSLSPLEQQLERLSWSSAEELPIDELREVMPVPLDRGSALDLVRFVVNQADGNTVRRDSELAALAAAGLLEGDVLEYEFVF